VGYVTEKFRRAIPEEIPWLAEIEVVVSKIRESSKNKRPFGRGYGSGKSI
jgi:hypothetical protein